MTAHEKQYYEKKRAELQAKIEEEKKKVEAQMNKINKKIKKEKKRRQEKDEFDSFDPKP